MSDEPIYIIVGMPVDEDKRAELARAAGQPKPIIYTGSVTRRCHDCDLEVYVGPRQAATLQADPSAVLICPWCIRKRADADIDLIIGHLGNPEKRR